MNKVHPIKIEGVVVKGSGEGRKIGIPTANIQSNDDFSQINQGVYAVLVRVNEKTYKGVAHYGPRAVFNDFIPQFEVHIFEYDGDLYNKKLEVELIEFIRPTIKFSGLKEMLEIIKKDISTARKILVLHH